MSTIKDVARRAKVSITTVSRVINQPDLVQEETRERVYAAMKDLAYSQNTLAQGLRSGHVKTIALLVGDISSPFHGTLAKAVNREGEARGYRVVLYDLDESVERLIAVLLQLQSSEASGVVIAISYDLTRPDVREAMAAVRRRGIRIITNSQIVDRSVPAVLAEFDKLTIRAVEYMDGIGVGPLIFISGGPGASLAKVASQGFQEAAQASGRDDSSAAILDGTFQVERSRQALKTHLAAHPSFMPAPGQRLGVITQTTRMAVGAMLAALDLGLNVPRDMPILCAEELPQATEFHPELTTLAIRLSDLAANIFERLMEKDDAKPVTYIEAKLIERGSTVEDPTV